MNALKPIAIIGACITGLTATFYLNRRMSGSRVAVVRVGGVLQSVLETVIPRNPDRARSETSQKMPDTKNLDEVMMPIVSFHVSFMSDSGKTTDGGILTFLTKP